MSGSVSRIPKSLLMPEALRRIRGRSALLVGDLMLDAYLYGETARVSREAPVLVVRKQRTEHRLGGAANTAANMAALGLRTQVVGCVGSDAAGETLRTMLANTGADVSGLIATPRTTPVKTRILAGAYGTAKQQVLRLDDEPSEAVPDEAQARIAELVREQARHVDVVVVSDYGTGALSDIVLDAVLQVAADGAKVCVDSRYQLLRYRGVTAVTPNVPEAEDAVGYMLTTPQAVERAGLQILEALNCQACLLTQGRGGMTLFEERATPSHVDIVGESEVTDVTGAGDTVLATFSGAMAAGLSLENAMRLANCAAGIVVCKAGAATAVAEEIIEVAESFGVQLV